MWSACNIVSVPSAMLDCLCTVLLLVLRWEPDFGVGGMAVTESEQHNTEPDWYTLNSSNLKSRAKTSGPSDREANIETFITMFHCCAAIPALVNDQKCAKTFEFGHFVQIVADNFAVTNTGKSACGFSPYCHQSHVSLSPHREAHLPPYRICVYCSTPLYPLVWGRAKRAGER